MTDTNRPSHAHPSPHLPTDHRDLRRRLVAAVEADERVIGLLDYGSTSEGRGDRWSDVDSSLFIRPADYDAFVAGWDAWLRHLGTVLLHYKPMDTSWWSIFDGAEFPIRADFNLYPADEDHLAMIRTWPNAPISVEAMLLVDKDGLLRPHVEAIVGQPLVPPDPHAILETFIPNFWYYVVRTWCRLQRGPSMASRYEIHFMLLGSLAGLLRMEAGRIERWRSSDAIAGIEDAISPERLASYRACVPGLDDGDPAIALGRIVRLAAEVTANVSTRYDVPWPAELARRMIAVTPGADAV
ncbi:MAG: hypothetical protein WBA46_03030 [Thermomicrobiales bacterium]